MKKQLTLAALAAMMLAGCADQTDLAVTESDGLQTAQAASEDYVTFGTYNSRPTTTRAGYEGSIRDAELRDNDKAKGFGVFAFHTGRYNYNPNAGTMVTRYPNFMYNEHVYYNDGTWKYDVLKPWPNGNNTADQSGATADTEQGAEYGAKVSFFAYAPYVSESTNWSAETDGIVGMSTNEHEGNPTITYKIAEDGKTVDLLWGTCPAGVVYKTVTGTDQRGAYYDPDKNTGAFFQEVPVSATTMASFNGDESLFPVNINLVKQTTGQKVNLLFKHALAKIGGAADKSTEGETSADADADKAGLLVILDLDENGEITGGAKPEYTKVLIRDIQINCNSQVKTDASGNVVTDASGNAVTEGLYTQGTLDLATGRWTIDTSVTGGAIRHNITSDGTTDTDLTATGGSDATINELLAEPASVEKTAAAFNALPIGVQSDRTINVYSSESLQEANPVVLIPGTIPVLTFTIDYVVRVKDAKLKDQFTEVKQRVTKTVTFQKAVELNKKYNIVMHLGLTNVKFTATVDNWDTTNDGTPTADTNGDGVIDEKDLDATPVYLPINVQ